jgi:hypothetical protein
VPTLPDRDVLPCRLPAAIDYQRADAAAADREPAMGRQDVHLGARSRDDHCSRAGCGLERASGYRNSAGREAAVVEDCDLAAVQHREIADTGSADGHPGTAAVRSGYVTDDIDARSGVRDGHAADTEAGKTANGDAAAGRSGVGCIDCDARAVCDR